MNRPEGCFLCPLDKIATSFSFPEGKANLGVAFYGECLGLHEAQENKPFRPNGESGSLLTQIVQNQLRGGNGEKLDRGDFIWDNAWKCKPPDGFKMEGGEFEKEVSRCCSQYNKRSIDREEVKVIVAFGVLAFRALTGIEGKKRGISDVRGYVFRADNGKYIVPSYHPAFIRRGNSRFTGATIHDIKKAIIVARGTYDSFVSHQGWKPPKFVLKGKLDALVSLYYFYRDNPGVAIPYDIETPWSKDVDEDEKFEAEEEGQEAVKEEEHIENEIKSIQFAKGKGWAITVPWEKPFIKVATAILSLGNDKLGFNNWMFDDPRLVANGVKIGGKIHDLMWAWHHLQPGLDKGLQKVASFFDFPYIWKHFASESDKEDEYGGSDVIALSYIWEKLPTRMKRMGVWDSYLKFKVRYREVLAATEKRGVPVNEEARTGLEGYLGEQIQLEDAVLQDGVPRELRNCKPKEGYKREPREITELRSFYSGALIRLGERGIQRENTIPFEEWAERRTGLSCREFEGVGGKNNKKSDVAAGDIELSLEEVEKVKRWCRIEPFKASSQQLIKYMKFRGYKIPLTLKTKKETTGKKDLIDVYERTGDEVLRSVIKIRSLGKMLNNDVPNWKPGEDGRVHTTFKFDPPSWQLNAVSPNILNARKHEPDPIAKEMMLGQRFRRIVQAPPGRCIVEFDKKAFHVVMMGFEARDPLYIKWAKVDMHSLFTSYIVNDPISLEGEPDLDKIGYIKKKFKIVRDTQAKAAVLGNNLGLGSYKLWWTNRYYYDENGKRQVGIESQKRAIYLQSMIAELFPKVERYKKRIQEKAHLKTYLISEFGALRWFHDVWRWDYKARRMKNGTEAEAAISHPVQSDAFGMLHSENIDMADNSEILEEHWWANTIHDSDIFFPEIGKRERCIEDVLPFMLKPQIELSDPVCCPGGLVVGVDVMVSGDGGNWANFDKERNPMGMMEVRI